MKKILLLGLILLFSFSFVFAQDYDANGHNNSIDDNLTGTALGSGTRSKSFYSMAAGFNSEAWNNGSFALGNNVYAKADNAWIIGSGYLKGSVRDNYTNFNSNSLMIGFNMSSKPSFFVEPFDQYGDGGGFVGIHTDDPTSTLDVNGTITTKGLRVVSETLIGSNWVLTADGHDGSVKWAAPTGSTGGGVSGSGTNGYIPNWNGTGSDLENSIIYTNGSGVGIGTGSSNLNSSYMLTVSGAILAQGGDSYNWNEAFNWGDHDLVGYIKMESNIPSGANLNGYANSGFYYQKYASYAGSGSNYPISKAGMLTVKSKDGKAYQSYQSSGSESEVYTRTGYGNTWTSWEKVWASGDFTQDDIDKWNSGSSGNLVGDGVWKVNPEDERSIFYLAGSVGIGTSQPQESLHTTGSILAEEGFKLRGDINTIEFGGGTSSSFQIVNGDNFTSNPAFTIDAGDNIGIGHGSPEAQLDVSGDVKISTTLNVGGTITAENNIHMIGIANQIEYGESSSSTFEIRKKVYSKNIPSLTSIITIDANNEVGIGTLNPSAKLHVAGDALVRDSLKVEGNLLVQKNLDINGDATVIGDILTQGSLSLNNSNSTVLYGVSGVRSSFSLINIAGTIKSGETSVKGAYDVEVLTVDGYNKVGIGTSTPNAKLHVAGDVLVRDSLKVDGNLLVQENLDVKGEAQILGELNFTTGSNQISFGEISTPKTLKIRSNYTTEAKGTFQGLAISAMGQVGIGIDNPSESLEVIGTTKTEGFQMTGGNAGNGKVLQSNDDGVASWVDPGTLSGVGIWDDVNSVAFYDGNVGIGTSNMGTHRLVVDGSINATLIKVTLDVPGSDYVFEADYSLMPLNELESFVKTNKHLPEVMSAEEFARDGYSLGEMDDILLRKVEELTLHAIEQNKQLMQQQVLLEKQQKLIDQLLEATK